ncbi:MAG: LuxR C-terminal-related transcriptional regulator [Muribaculum sp.]|nr:LuxR C-terminal-related transcriptional regulator [Muribaculum sp.]
MTVILLTDDTLQGIGLRYLLRQYFDIDATIATSADESADTPSTLYFVSPQRFAASLDFFIPRRSRTIITGENLRLDGSESVIVERLDSIVKNIEQRCPDNESAELSQREIEVLSLVARGLINKEIADKLNISFNTVLSHRKNITAKLGIKSVSGLSVYAIMNGYISESDLQR